MTDGDACHSLLTHYAGVPAGQIWADYLLWEHVLNAHPGLKAVAEIGTWQGGFSRYLWNQCHWRRLAFRTYDVVAPEADTPGFRLLDVFANPEPVQRFLTWAAPALLFCDGGNKAREIALFAPSLSSGSVVIVHDWLTEIQPEEVSPMLHPIHESLCDELGSMSRVFQA